MAKTKINPNTLNAAATHLVQQWCAGRHQVVIEEVITVGAGNNTLVARIASELTHGERRLFIDVIDMMCGAFSQRGSDRVHGLAAMAVDETRAA